MSKIVWSKYDPTTGNWSLLILVMFTVFLIPLFPFHLHALLFNITYSLILIIGALSMEQHRKVIVGIAFIAVIAEWMSYYFQMPLLLGLSRATKIIFFSFVILRLILQIAGTKKVNARVILESINGYLMLGLVFGLITGAVIRIDPQAYSFSSSAGAVDSDNILTNIEYYTFVTFTTLGYGDMVPKIPIAKSLAMLTAISGQIYIAIIIAMLVGKYAGSKQE